MNEKALIKKCRLGDRQAFDALIRLYYDYVSGFLVCGAGGSHIGRFDRPCGVSGWKKGLEFPEKMMYNVQYNAPNLQYISA